MKKLAREFIWSFHIGGFAFAFAFVENKPSLVTSRITFQFRWCSIDRLKSNKRWLRIELSIVQEDRVVASLCFEEHAQLLQIDNIKRRVWAAVIGVHVAYKPADDSRGPDMSVYDISLQWVQPFLKVCIWFECNCNIVLIIALAAWWRQQR